MQKNIKNTELFFERITGETKTLSEIPEFDALKAIEERGYAILHIGGVAADVKWDGVHRVVPVDGRLFWIAALEELNLYWKYEVLED